MKTTLCDYKDCREVAIMSMEKGIVNYDSMQKHDRADLCVNHCNVSITDKNIKYRSTGW